MELFSPRVWLSILLASVIGFGAGYSAKGKLVIATEAVQDRKIIAAGADGIIASVIASEKLEAKVSASDSNVDKIKTAVIHRGVTLLQNPQEIHDASVQASNAVQGCDSFTLDNGTVGLLNAARSGGAVESVTGSDEALSDPSTITVGKLVINDLDVVKLYHDLATRHDQLVDEVERELAQRAK